MGIDPLERRAMRDFRSRMKKITREYIRLLENIPATPITANRAYSFRLDGPTLTSMLADVNLFVDFILLEGGASNLWFYEAYVSVAAVRGAAQEHANLSAQSPVYRAGRQTLQQITGSEPFILRMSLLAAREFEEMQGLAGSVKADMARVLTDGMARGQNPRTIARTLQEQTGINARRANKIARTEIGAALRRARLDEADDARKEFNLVSLEMHQSALSPTTRATHAARHGNLYTTDQQRDWWSEDGNAINCKCSSITVLVDEDGKPLVPEIIERAKKNKRVMLERRKKDQ